ncbi:hypothetical protein [Lacipirellula parvula]|uniref:Uncharacterized protein n=1 Tax=Lacipirellula parvula TaxID=2650471 RepID=A0A5K7X8L8_9BACT|nr:hypothetical protein [Lacipirellula parvula]BBO32990.1 hypothetical protein PLANPX_2602 [Lacipirellula parvula]
MANDPQQFRVQDDRFEGEAYAPAPPKKRSAFATCLTGCLIAFVVMLVLGAIAIWWAYKNIGTLAASLGSTFAKEVINQTELPAEEKADINFQIDRLATAAKDGKVSGDQIESFFTELVESPLLTTLVMSVIDKKYITPSGLSDEEKAEARVTIQRFMRGSIDKKITQAQMNKAMEPVSTKDKNGNVQLKNQVTDDELRAFLTNAKADADAAGVPAEVPEVDPSDEFKRLVDKTLEEGGKAPAGENAAPADEATSEDEAEPAAIEQPAESNP